MNNTSMAHFLNTSNNITAPSSSQHPLQLLCWFIAVLLTNAAGTIANCILLCAMTVHKDLRRSSSCALIAHCIVIDLYTTAVSVPTTTIAFYLGPTYPLPENFCKFLSLFIYIPYAASMHASAVLALHRLAATIFPRQFAFFTTKPAIVCMIVYPWIISFALNIFPAVEIGVRIIRSQRSGGCSVVPAGNNPVPLMVETAFGYYLPTALMGVSYIIVLIKTKVDIRRKFSSRTLRRRLEISRTLFLSFLWHCITVYPPSIIPVFFVKAYITNFAFELGVKFLASSFSAVNPVFFVASSKLFQEGVKMVLRCGWCRIRAVVPNGELRISHHGATETKLPLSTVDRDNLTSTKY